MRQPGDQAAHPDGSRRADRTRDTGAGSGTRLEDLPGRPAPAGGAPAPLSRADRGVPESVGYRLKRRLLGPPLVTARLHEERLSKPLALGVLAPDCISSSAYGTEEILIELLPLFGLLGFTLVLPITGVILVILVLLTLSYREIVTVYTRAGGSYVVARENFGPRVAQIAAVALLIDYVVTVAVQSAAGTVAVASAFPVLGPYSLEITIGVVLAIAYGNLRGLREAGRAFALPTYLFTVAVASVIVTGVIRAIFGHLPRYDLSTLHGTVPVSNREATLTAFAVVLTLLRSFANGGASLTGLEAISNGVSAFRRPEGINARRVLVIMACILGFLVAGVSWLAHVTHSIPFVGGYPSVLSQEARAVFGRSAIGNVLFFFVQAASALILYTGANTSFNGFPYLASFVAADSFLPRQLTKRGHRLVFSNGIIVLTAVSIVLLIATNARVNSLVPFYAIGVFTGFTMAGFGMAKYHRTQREQGWRHKLVINSSAGALSLLVVLIFAIAKFTEGAWLVVIIFPILVVLLIRLNQRYHAEEVALVDLAPIIDTEPNPVYHVILVLVDRLDLAVLRALRYARSMRPDRIRAVHFVIDNVHAERLADRWSRFQRGDIVLELRECPDRRLRRAALELTAQLVADGRTEVTVVLPRRTYPGLAGRLLHDRTADRIAGVISRVPHAAATIVPFDVDAAIRRLSALRARRPVQPPPPAAPEAEREITEPAEAEGGGRRVPGAALRRRPAERPAEVAQRPPGAGPIDLLDRPSTPIANLAWRQRQTVEGRITAVHITPITNSQIMEVELTDESGSFLVLFYGRTRIPGIRPGGRMRAEGVVGSHQGHLAISNPTYQLLPENDDD